MVITIEGTLAPPRRSACAEDVRACEKDEPVRAAVSRRIEALAREAEARGEPIFLERAVRTTRFAHEPGSPGEAPRVRFVVDLKSFARDEERRGAAFPYAPREGIRFADPAAQVLDDTFPRFVSADGSTRVTLVFGQLGKKDLWPDDPGNWSADEAERLLGAQGFVGQGDTFRRGAIVVRIVRPAGARLRSAAATEAVRRALAESDVVYVNGHARSGLFDELPRVRELAPKLVFVDTCWSYGLETDALQAAYPRATLIVTDGRVVTGSVAVVPALLEAATRGPRVGGWLSRINDAAARRASLRSEQRALDPLHRGAEVYGIVPARREGAGAPWTW